MHRRSFESDALTASSSEELIALDLAHAPPGQAERQVYASGAWPKVTLIRWDFD